MTQNQVVIASAVRTPLGAFLGSLKNVKATDLGALVIKEALNRAGVKAEQVDEVVMGNVLQAGLGQNPARQAALSCRSSTRSYCYNNQYPMWIRFKSCTLSNSIYPCW